MAQNIWTLTFVIAFTAFNAFYTFSQPKTCCKITGIIRGAGNAIIKLGNKETGPYSLTKTIYYDSIRANSDSFKLMTCIPNTQFYSIEIPSLSNECLFFINDNSHDVTIHGDLTSISKSIVSGSPDHDLYEIYHKKFDTLYTKEIDYLYNKRAYFKKVRDSNQVVKYIDSINIFFNKYQYAQIEFMSRHPNEFISLIILQQLLSLNYISNENGKRLLNRLGKNLILTNLYQRVLLKLKIKYKQGMQVPKISNPDSSETLIQLNPTNSKLTLINFWASWCGPCRKELPVLIQLYNQYHPKGFDVYGISINTNRENWIKATIEEKIPWPNTCDLEGMNNIYHLMFDVRGIPYSILINSKNEIVMTYFEDDLTHLKELLDRKLNK